MLKRSCPVVIDLDAILFIADVIIQTSSVRSKDLGPVVQKLVNDSFKFQTCILQIQCCFY